MNDDLLELLQADITAILKQTPGLADATILADNEGDIESRVETSLSTLNEVNGKMGLSIVVLRPDVTGTESELPGPPMTIETQIQILEDVLVNRDETSGTGVRTSQAALRVLGALQHQTLGKSYLYAPERNAIREAKVKAGFVSHVVTVLMNSTGWDAPGKPANVVSRLDGVDAVAVSGTPELDDAGLLREAGIPADSNSVAYTSDGNLTAPATGMWTILRWIPADSVAIESYLDGNLFVGWISADAGAGTLPSMDIRSVGNWIHVNGFETGEPVVAIATAESIILTCATSGADIYYTTDGSYPTPDNGELYADPITAEAGTYRAAAYAAAMNPGNATRFIISED